MKKESNFIYIIITVIIVSIFAVTTYFLIQYTNNNKYNIAEKIPVRSKDFFDVLSFTDKYNENDIIFIPIKDKYKVNTCTVNINYFAIDGLNDIEVQDKIDEKIKKKVYSLIPSDDVLKELKSDLVLNTEVQANFNNVLSIYISIYSEKWDANLYISDRVGLNIELVKGEDIKFLDIFRKESNVNKIFEDRMYANLSKNVYTSGTWNEEFDQYVIEKIDYEDEILYNINQLMKNKDNLNFYFTNQEVVLLKEYYSLYDFRFYDYIKDIAIFNRYLKNESIFRDADLNKNEDRYVLGNYGEDALYSYLDFKEPNFIVDAVVYNYTSIKGAELKMFFENYINEEVNKAKTRLLKDDNLAYYGIYIFLSDYYKSGGFENGILGGLEIYTEEKQYSKDNIDDFHSNLTYRVRPNDYIPFQIFDFKNMQIINNIPELFVDGYEYLPILKQNIQIQKGNIEISDEEMQEILSGQLYYSDNKIFQCITDKDYYDIDYRWFDSTMFKFNVE